MPDQNAWNFTEYYQQFVSFQKMKLSSLLQKYRHQFLTLLQGGCKLYVMPIAKALRQNAQECYVWDEKTKRLSYIDKPWGKIALVHMEEGETLSLGKQEQCLTLIKQGERYFFYGSPDGSHWEFTALNTEKMNEIDIDFNELSLISDDAFEQVYQEIVAQKGHILPKNRSLSGYQGHWMSEKEAEKLKSNVDKGLLDPHDLRDDRIYLTRQGDVLTYWIKDASDSSKVFSDSLSLSCLNISVSAGQAELVRCLPAILQQVSQKGHLPFTLMQEDTLTRYVTAHRDQLQHEILYLKSEEAKKLIPLYQSYFSPQFSSYLLNANEKGVPFTDFSDMYLRSIQKKNKKTWLQYLRITKDNAHLDNLDLPMDKPTLIRVQEGVQNHYYIYGNTQGYEWKLNPLDVGIVTKANIDFPAPGAVTTLNFDKKYALLYEHIGYDYRRHTHVTTEPEKFAQIKNMFNAVYYGELVLADIEKIGVSVNATWDTFKHFFSRETSANAYQAVSLLTEFGVDFSGAFSEEINQILSVFGILSKMAQPYLLDETKQNTWSAWFHWLGQGSGIAIDKMNPNPEKVDFDFIAQFSAQLPSYIDKITAYLHKYARSTTTGAGFTDAQIKELSQEGFKLLNTLENLKQGANFGGNKMIHLFRLLSQITTLSMKALDEINHLSNESQDILRGYLREIKYELLPEIFTFIDKLEAELMLQPGLLSKPMMQRIKPWYDFLIDYAKSPIQFALQGEELLEIEDSFFIKKRLQLMQRRTDNSHQILFQLALDRAQAQAFFDILSQSEHSKTVLSVLPAAARHALLGHYKALEPYIKKSDPDLNNQIIRHLMDTSTKPALETQKILGFKAKLNAIFTQMHATENLKLRLANDIAQSIQETTSLTIFPFHKRIGFDLRLLVIDENKVLSELSLSQDKPTLIQQGSQYFIYGNGYGAAWGYTPLNAHVVEAQKLPFGQKKELPYDARPNYRVQLMPEGLPEGFIPLPDILYVTIVDDALEYTLVDEQEPEKTITNVIDQKDLGYFEEGITQSNLELCLPDILKITQERGETTHRYQNLYDEMISKRAHTVFTSIYDLDESIALQRMNRTHPILFAGRHHNNRVINADSLTYEEAFKLHRWYQHQLHDMHAANEAHAKLLTLLDTQFKEENLFLFDDKQDDLKSQCAVLYAQIQPYLIGLNRHSVARITRFDKSMAHVLSGDRCTKVTLKTYFLSVAEIKALLVQSPIIDTEYQSICQTRAAFYSNLAKEKYHAVVQHKEIVAQAIYEGCAVVHLAQKPSSDALYSLAGKHAAAYVRVSRFENGQLLEDKLYYLNKQTQEFKELSISEEKLRLFDQQFPQDQTVQTALFKKIATLTGHLHIQPENRINYVMKHTECSKNAIALREQLEKWFNLLSEPLKQKLLPLPKDATYGHLTDLDDVLEQSQQVVLLKRLFNAVSQLETGAKQLELLSRSELKEVTLSRVGLLYWKVQDVLAISQLLIKDPYFAYISTEFIELAQNIRNSFILHSTPYSKSAIDVRPIPLANKYTGLWYSLNAVMAIPEHIRALERGDALKEIGHQLEIRQVGDDFDFKQLRPGQPLLIKQGERYFIFGNSKGACWKLTELDAPIFEAIPINFMKGGCLPYHRKYEAIYKNILAKEGHTTKLDELQIAAKKATLNIEKIINDSSSYFRLFLDSPMIYCLFFELKDQLTLLTTTVNRTVTNNLEKINTVAFTKMLLEADAWESRLNSQPGLLSSPMKAILDEFYRGLVAPLEPKFKPQMALVGDFSPLNQRVEKELKRLANASQAIHSHESHLRQLDSVLEKLQQAYDNQKQVEPLEFMVDPTRFFYHEDTSFLPQLSEQFKQVLTLLKSFNQFAETQDLPGLGLLDLKNAMKRIVKKGYDAPDVRYKTTMILEKNAALDVLYVTALESGLYYQIKRSEDTEILSGEIPFSVLNFTFTHPITQTQIDACTPQILSYAVRKNIIHYGRDVEKIMAAVDRCRHYEAGLLDTATLAKDTSHEKLDFLNHLRAQQLLNNEVLKLDYAKKYLKKEIDVICARTLGLFPLANEYRQKLNNELLFYKKCDICIMPIDRAQALGKRSCYVWDKEKQVLAYLPFVGDAEPVKMKTTKKLVSFLTKNTRKIREDTLSVSSQDIEDLISMESEHSPKFDLFIRQLNSLEQVDVDIHARLRQKSHSFETKHIQAYYQMDKVIIAIQTFQAYLALSLTDGTKISVQERGYIRAKQDYLAKLQDIAHDTTQDIGVRFSKIQDEVKNNEDILIRYEHHSFFSIAGWLQYFAALLHSLGLWTSTKRQHYEALVKATQEVPDMPKLTHKFGLFYEPNQQQPKAEGNEPDKDEGIEHDL